MIPDLVRKDGQSLQKFFEDNETLAMLEDVRKWLASSEVFSKYLSSEVVSTKSLAGLIIQMLNCYETSFGRNVSKPVMTRLPVKLFLDFRPGGALCLILGTMYRVKSERNWRRFDFTSPNRLDSVAEALMAIEECLVQAKLFSVPIVFIRPDVDPKLSVKLVEILKRHKGNVTSNFEEATHVIYPPGPPPPTDEDFVRPIYNNGTNCLVHLWFYPDSCVCFLPSHYVPTIESKIDIHDLQMPAEKYEVNARWVLDLDDFNEWMCEDDYALNTAEGKKFMTSPVYRNTITPCIPVSSINERVSGKRKKSPSPVANNSDKKKRKTAPKKRRADEDESSSDINFDQNSMTSPNKVAPDSSSSDIPTFTPDDAPKEEAPVSTKPVESEASTSFVTAASTSQQSKETSSVKEAPQKEASTNCAAEKANQSSIDFTKNQVTVLETANAALKDSSSKHKTATEQTHHIIMPSYAAWFDYNAIHAIEKRALPEFFNEKNKSKTPEIYLSYRNFMIDSYRINPQEYLSTTALRRNLTGDVCALMRIQSFLEQWGLINFQIDLIDRPKPMGPPATSHFHVLGDTPSGLKPIQPVRPSKIVEPKKEVISEAKDSAKTTEGASSVVDASSIAAGAGTVLAKNLGLRTDKYTKVKDKQWSDKELLSLLEAVELFKDDWNRVAEHVGTRTQHQCIMQFLQLPIEDPYVDPSKLNGLEEILPVPYSQQGNPLMTTVAFLSSVVDPRIAKMATESALEKFEEINEELPKAFVEEKIKEAEKQGVTEVKGIVKLSDIAGCDEEEIVADNDEDGKEESEDAKKDKKSDKKDEKIAETESEEGKTEEAMETDVGGATSSETSADSDATIEAMGCVAGAPQDDVSEASKPESKVAQKSEESTEGKLSEEKMDEDSEVTVKKEYDPEEAKKSLTVAASTALAASAVKARHLQGLEERRIKSLVAIVIETQMKKLDMKMKYFEELESMIEKERDTLECQKTELMKERQQFYMEQIKTTEEKLKGVGMADMALEALTAKKTSTSSSELVIPASVVTEKPSHSQVASTGFQNSPTAPPVSQHYGQPGPSQPSGFVAPTQPTTRPQGPMRGSPGPASHPSYAAHPISRQMQTAPGTAQLPPAGSGHPYHPAGPHGQMHLRPAMGAYGSTYAPAPGSPASASMQSARPEAQQPPVQPRPNSRTPQAPPQSETSAPASVGVSMAHNQHQPSYATSSPSSSVSSASGSSVSGSSAASVQDSVKSGVFPIKQVANPSAAVYPPAAQNPASVGVPYQHPKYPSNQPGSMVPSSQLAARASSGSNVSQSSIASSASSQPHAATYAGTVPTPQPAGHGAPSGPPPSSAPQSQTGPSTMHYGNERPGYPGHPSSMMNPSGPYANSGTSHHGYTGNAPPSAHQMPMYPQQSASQMPHRGYQAPSMQQSGHPENPNYPPQHQMQHQGYHAYPGHYPHPQMGPPPTSHAQYPPPHMMATHSTGGQPAPLPNSATAMSQSGEVAAPPMESGQIADAESGDSERSMDQE